MEMKSSDNIESDRRASDSDDVKKIGHRKRNVLPIAPGVSENECNIESAFKMHSQLPKAWWGSGSILLNNISTKASPSLSENSGTESVNECGNYDESSGCEERRQVDIEKGKNDKLKCRRNKDFHLCKRKKDGKYLGGFKWLLEMRKKGRVRAGSEKIKNTNKLQGKETSKNRADTKILRRNISEYLILYIKQHITVIFWVRLGVRFCMSLLYIAMAKCENDLVANVYNQQDNLCIKHNENVEPVEKLLTFATFPIIPDFFMGVLGILPLYRLYNDPFVFGYNLIMAILCIWTGVTVRIELVKCGEMVTNLIIYSANILICMGCLHLVPFFITFLMIRKGEELFFINRFLYFFTNPPVEGHWWSLPRRKPIEFVNIELIDENRK